MVDRGRPGREPLGGGQRRRQVGRRRRRRRRRGRRRSAALSSPGVPWATVRPWSRTTMSSASRSASSRYWVVRTMVVPSRTRSRSMSHRSPRLRGSRPVVGSSRNRTVGPRHQAGGEVEPPAHAAGERLHQVARLRRPGRAARAARRPGGRRRAGGRSWSRPTITRLALAVSSPSTVACWAATPMRRRTRSGSATTSRPATAAVPVGGRGQRGEDADGRGLAGAVVAEQAEHGAGGDVEVEVAQGPEVAEALAEAAGVGRPPAGAAGSWEFSYAVPLCRT